MKPFNLEAAIAGKPVVTRDGWPVTRVIHLPELNQPNNVLVTVNGSGWVVFPTGNYCAPSEGTHDMDLLMASKITKSYIAIGPPDNEGTRNTSNAYPTRGQAERIARMESRKSWQVVEIEVEE